MNIAQFRSLWGLEGQKFDVVFPVIKQQGFKGVEASLQDIGFYQDMGKSFCSALIESDLQFVCGVYTSWDNYEGCWERKSVHQHISQLTNQLQDINTLSVKPVRINVHAGSDDFTLDEAIQFFSLAIPLERIVGDIIVCYETHRGRILYSPWVAKLLFPLFPQLKITLDLSHWVVVAERLLNAKEDWEFIKEQVIPRCAHIHSRIGQAQAPQLPSSSATADCNKVFKTEIEFFRSVWESIYLYRKANNTFDSLFTVTPEYGPEPYKPYVFVEQTIETMLLSEMNEINDIFTF